jgi:zinc transport system ATP-binding protein
LFGEPFLEISGLRFAYTGNPVLEGVNLTLSGLEFAAVVGPNGGGKTTLLKLILGLFTPDAGRVRVFGLSPRQASCRIGYMPQHVQVDLSFPVTVTDVVLMGRLGRSGGVWGGYVRRDRAAVAQTLERVGLVGLADRPFRSLSGGQRQRTLIARALAGEPKLLLLDEPTANVDVVGEREVFDLLAELNRCIPVLVVSHDLGFVSPYVGQVVCVNRKVVIHPTSQVTGEIISQIYGREVRMVRHDYKHEGACSL